MLALLETVGISKKNMESLNTIHVTGTKGKGTTCAFTESILRKAGLRTGFFSSPHLVVVRERIQINGEPISPEKFAKYFFPVYKSLMAYKEKDPEFQMPPYFRLLTCMAFYTFLKEKVDVAIFEVGIGGRYDCTNVIPNPTVVGITSLGLEHQSILGNTLEEIAWNKAGIIKPNSPAFTVYNHPDSILKLMQNCAAEVNSTLSVVPKLSQLSEKVSLGVQDGNVSELNAALAVQLSTCFLRQKFPQLLPESLAYDEDFASPSTLLSPWHVVGLKETKWPGRFQKMELNECLTYYLDGAHTKESLAVSREWFTHSSKNNSFRVIIFNVTGERASDLLVPFAKSNVFDLAIFCPVARREMAPDRDNWNILSDGADLVNACKKHEETWKSTNDSSFTIVRDSTDSAVDFISDLFNESTRLKHLEMCNGKCTNKQLKTVDVLVTGSLYLVGNVLSILNPSLNDDK